MCDAPARAFIKGIKSHTGYYGCDKCQQKGSYVKHRMTFPENDASCRTDEAFRLGLDEEHHLTHCPLLETDIDMVTGFPHDYMHLVCLGVVRRLTDLWCGAVGPLRTRLSSIQVLGISERLVALKEFIPAEFARKPRALSERLRWKATEFRQLLLYTGPVVLKGTSRAGNYSQPLAREDAETMNCTSRAGNYSQPLAREDAETMNCTSRAGNYSQPLAREDAETINCEYLKTLGMYQQSRELLSTTGQRRRRDYELYQQSRELLSTTGQRRRRDYELYQQSRELLSTTGQRRRRDYELYQQSRELLSTTGQRGRRDYKLSGSEEERGAEAR
ncbi:unnamed protein product [Leuciscus chuanchicus]